MSDSKVGFFRSAALYAIKLKDTIVLLLGKQLSADGVVASSVALMITQGALAGLKKLHELMIEQIFTTYVIQEHTSAHSYFQAWLHSLPEAQSNIVECSYDNELEQVKTMATTGGKVSMYFNGVRIWINPGAGTGRRRGRSGHGDGYDDYGPGGTVVKDDLSQKTYITLIGKNHQIIDEIIAKGKAIYNLKKHFQLYAAKMNIKNTKKKNSN